VDSGEITTTYSYSIQLSICPSYSDLRVPLNTKIQFSIASDQENLYNLTIFHYYLDLRILIEDISKNGVFI
jgi:hypothetical protein